MSKTETAWLETVVADWGSLLNAFGFELATVKRALHYFDGAPESFEFPEAFTALRAFFLVCDSTPHELDEANALTDPTGRVALACEAAYRMGFDDGSKSGEERKSPEN